MRKRKLQSKMYTNNNQDVYCVLAQLVKWILPTREPRTVQSTL